MESYHFWVLVNPSERFRALFAPLPHFESLATPMEGKHGFANLSIWKYEWDSNFEELFSHLPAKWWCHTVVVHTTISMHQAVLLLVLYGDRFNCGLIKTWAGWPGNRGLWHITQWITPLLLIVWILRVWSYVIWSRGIWHKFSPQFDPRQIIICLLDDNFPRVQKNINYWRVRQLFYYLFYIYRNIYRNLWDCRWQRFPYLTDSYTPLTHKSGHKPCVVEWFTHLCAQLQQCQWGGLGQTRPPQTLTWTCKSFETLVESTPVSDLLSALDRLPLAQTIAL